MFIDVTETLNENIEGWTYENKQGDTEYVKIFNQDIIEIKDADEARAYIYVADIDKLIRALQHAKAHLDKKV